MVERGTPRGVPILKTAQPPARIQIENPAPLVDGGRFPAKRCVGDTVRVTAEIFKDGHDVLRAVVRYRAPGARRWSEAPMTWVDRDVDGDTWAGEFTVDRCGRWSYSVEAWTDEFATWRDELARKLAAGQEDLTSELSEGQVLLERACERARAADRRLIQEALAVLRDDTLAEQAKHAAALRPELYEAVERHPERPGKAVLDSPVELDVDRLRARFGSWYELFPRSFGGFRGVTEQIPRLAELGFDVLYLPPIHPIGVTNRKGRNNSLRAAKGDPGSPWAIGGKEGGHTALHPELGSFEDFDRMVATAQEHDIDIALDFAIQCSADHPWLREHPEWFHRRPDGTLKYAENPPKRYQDIYNVNFDSESWKELWQALYEVVLFWVERGVRAFRVDNPHTKPIPFWEWLIAEVRRDHPEVIFLSEAFTRWAKMTRLAKAGFSQSYTYFTWQNSRWELMDLMDRHLAAADFLRPNFFANTPDILHEYLQHGGPPAFTARLVLAATLSPSYGIYSGFEHFENTPVRTGSEEYLDSEKYEVKERALDGPLLPLVQRINAARRENPALQRLDNLMFLDTENEALIAYAKQAPGNLVLTVVNLDPQHVQEGIAVVPAALGTAPAFQVEDLLTGERFDWGIGRNYVRLDPAERGAHVLRVVA